ncbi:hypothetical protein [Streptomyces mirabilis]|uniref:hypothetical protein n=1 Tax=Streptomyces mirabilis TaxID=68239 RepID=UPI003687C11E
MNVEERLGQARRALEEMWSDEAATIERLHRLLTHARLPQTLHFSRTAQASGAQTAACPSTAQDSHSCPDADGERPDLALSVWTSSTTAASAQQTITSLPARRDLTAADTLTAHCLAADRGSARIIRHHRG